MLKKNIVNAFIGKHDSSRFCDLHTTLSIVNNPATKWPEI